MLQLKVVLLGDQNVGKSSIAVRFVSGEYRGAEDPTIGAAYLMKTLDFDGKTLKFNLWDTAGQEKFHTLAKMYYRDADAAILVYDITSEASFKGLQRWYEELLTNGPSDIIKVIVGNKEDLVDQEAVPMERARAFCNEIGADYKKASAKSGAGINEVFRIIASKRDSGIGTKDRRESIQILPGAPQARKKADGKGCCK